MTHPVLDKLGKEIVELKVEQRHLKQDVGEIKTDVKEIRSHLMSEKNRQVTWLQKIIAIFMAAAIGGGSVYGATEIYKMATNGAASAHEQPIQGADNANTGLTSSD